MAASDPPVRHIATFCGRCSCGGPQLHVDDELLVPLPG